MGAAPETISEALEMLRAEKPSAWERLVPMVYRELKGLATHYFRHERSAQTLQATALVNEAFLRLDAMARKDWHSRSQFLAAAARAMRQILVERARARSSEKRGGAYRRIALVDDVLSSEEGKLDLLALESALQELTRRHPRQAQVVEFRFYGGLGHEESAALLDVSTATVKGDWRMAKAWLRLRLQGGPEQ